MEKTDNLKMGQELLRRYKTIAVVGISRNENKPSHRVPKYLKEHGYTIIGINPSADGEILGVKVYPSLRAIPGKVDVVDIFRPSADIPPIVDEAIAIGAKAVWMQEGIVHEEAGRKAEAAGLEVVMDLCMLKVHQSGI
ncbi:MAG TPA: CoA-binding protein [Nitrospiria bacterium]|nr:CoA-binding protein [Nitrospiria bacterium]